MARWHRYQPDGGAAQTTTVDCGRRGVTEAGPRNGVGKRKHGRRLKREWTEGKRRTWHQPGEQM